MPTLLESEPRQSPTRPSTALQVEPERTRVSRTVLNYWLDAGLLVCAVFDVWVTLLLRVIFPAPTTADGWTLWGLAYNDWHDIQFFALGLTGLLTVEHLVLHWGWICNVTAQILQLRTRPDEGVQAVLGVGTFVTLALTVLAGLLAALVCVQSP